MNRIIQYHPAVVGADAIGNSILSLHKLLLAQGIESYVSCRDDQVRFAPTYVLPVSSILNAVVGKNVDKDDVLLVHYSFYDEWAEQLAQLPIIVAIVYHNITPGHYFNNAGMESLGRLCDAARSQLARMASSFAAAVGDSEYNCSELRDLGYRAVSRVPVFVDIAGLRSSKFDRAAAVRFRESAELNILFVGRFVPNKRVDLVISTVAAFRSAFPLTINLHLVGKIWDHNYFSSLIAHAGELGVCDRLRFYHSADQIQLRTLFAVADAFVCMSEHEGFMVPIVEAFAAGCPVIAADASAIRETMGGAGILIDAPDPEFAASLIYLLKTDRPLRRRVTMDQSRRADDFHLSRTGQMWFEKIRSLRREI
jgi:glycosyltransferase involved in cell wall biosynthesis